MAEFRPSDRLHGSYSSMIDELVMNQERPPFVELELFASMLFDQGGNFPQELKAPGFMRI